MNETGTFSSPCPITSCDENPALCGVSVALEVFFDPSGLSHSMRQIAVAGDPISHTTNPLQPCSFALGVSTDTKLIESFGPIVAVVRVGSIDDAVRVANDTEYGLSAAVFGRDVGRALTVAQRIESGICHINASTVHDEAQMPFGGVKASGYGRFGGKAAVDEFTDLRWITVQTTPRHYPI